MNRWVKLSLKIAATALLIYFLVRQADLPAIGAVLGDASLPWIAFGAALGIPVMVASGIRWRQISGYLRVPLPWRFAILGYMEGITFNLLLPGSLGGDVLRVAKVTKAYGQLRRNLVAVLFDRASNLGVLLAVCLVMMAFVSLGPGAGRVSIVLGGLIIALVCGVMALLFALRFRSLKRFRVVRETIYLATMFKSVYLRIDRLTAVALWSLLAQGFAVGMFAASAQAIGLSDLSVLELSIATMLGLLAAAAPLTIAGLGLREGTIIWVLLAFGADQANAYSAAILFGALLILQSIPGLIIWVAGLARLEGGRKQGRSSLSTS